MKFYCDKCQTKYSIADEKVRGKVLKVRCKNCSHVITVREAVSPAHADATATLTSGALGQSAERRAQPASGSADSGLASAAAAIRERNRQASLSNAAVRAPSSAASSVSWHYSVNGESFGPFTFEHLRTQFATAKLTDAAYVWNETFDAWKPVGEVAEFASALTSSAQIRPSRATIGVSGALQAIKLEDYKTDNKQVADEKKQEVESELLSETTVDIKKDPSFRFGEKPLVEKPAEQVSALLDEETLKDPSPGSEEFPTLVESRMPGLGLEAERSEPVDGQSAAESETLKGDESLVIAEQNRRAESAGDRLQRLRDRLKGDESPMYAKHPKAEKPVSDKAAQEPKAELEERTVELAPAVVEAPVAGEITLKDPVVSPLEAKQHDGLFDAVDEITLQEEAAAVDAASDAEADDFFSSAPAVDDDSDFDAEAVPFLTTAPKLSSAHGYDRPAEEAYSGSLLIELDKLKKEQKSKRVLIVVAAVALLAVVGGIIVWVSSIESTVETNQVAVQKEAPREIVFRRYSKEEQGRIRNLIEIPDEVVAEPAEPDLAGNTVVKVNGAPAKAIVEPKAVKNTPTVVAEKSAPAVDPFEASMRGASSHNPVESNSGLQRNDGAVATGMKTGPSSAGAKVEAPDDDRFKALAAIQMPSGDAPIYQPSDALKNRGKRGAAEAGGLTDAQASAGFQSVRQSIGLCRERTMQRGLKLDTQKIYVTLEIQPTGKVSSYTVEPSSVRGTEFDRCMVSHTSRWKFASYSGETTLIKAPFILQ